MTKKLPPVFEQKLRALRKAQWEANKAIADQAQTHRHESLALAVEHQRMKEALQAAVELLQWLKTDGVGSWTPANSAQLEEWKELSK